MRTYSTTSFPELTGRVFGNSMKISVSDWESWD